MKNYARFLSIKLILTIIYLSFSITTFAQDNSSPPPKASNYFWEKVQFGGAFGLSVGSGFTDITLAPNAIYNFNRYVSLGAGLQGSYISSNIDGYKSAIYGGSLITLFNPIEQMQLSIEVEQVRVNRTLNLFSGDVKDNFWNTGLFFGAGYRVENVTIGGRYNVLYNRNDLVYGDAFMPFIRVYF